MGVPLLQRASTAGEIYARALFATYKQWRVYDQSEALRSDFDAYRKIMTDPVIAQAIYYRKHLVAGRVWQLEAPSDKPEDKAAADVLDALLRKMDRFDTERFNLANAIFRGGSYAEITGDEFEMRLGDNVPRKWWAPVRLVDVDKRRFRKVPHYGTDDSGRPSLSASWELFSVEKNAWEPVVYPAHFVKHIYDDEESGLGYGRGLIDSLYFFWRAKEKILEIAEQGAELWGRGGFVLGLLDGLRETDTINEDLAETFLRTLETMRSGHVMIADKTDNVSIVAPSGTGHQICTDLLKYLDEAMRCLILGANLPTSATSGGSYAMAEVQENSTAQIVHYDRRVLAATMTRDLVGLAWYLNRHNLAEVGLGGAACPRFSIVSQKDEDPKAMTEIVVQLLNARIPLKKQEVYEALPFTQPSETDDVFEKAEQLPGMPAPGVPAGFPGTYPGTGTSPAFPFSEKPRKAASGRKR